MSERKRIYLCLAHMSEDGMEQKAIMVHGLNDLNDNTNNDYKLEDIEKQ